MSAAQFAIGIVAFALFVIVAENVLARYGR